MPVSGKQNVFGSGILYECGNLSKRLEFFRQVFLVKNYWFPYNFFHGCWKLLYEPVERGQKLWETRRILHEQMERRYCR